MHVLYMCIIIIHVALHFLLLPFSFPVVDSVHELLEVEQSIGIPADRIVLGELSICYYMLMRDEEGRKKEASK